jgi:hypothetical protein
MAIQAVAPTISLEEKQTVRVQGLLTPTEFQLFEHLRSLTRRHGELEFTAIRPCVFTREMILIGLKAFEIGLQRKSQTESSHENGSNGCRRERKLVRIKT